MTKLIFISFIIIHFTGFSQVVSGEVQDTKGIGIPGVLIKNTTQNKLVRTESNGDFRITGRVQDTLLFIVYGFDTARIEITLKLLQKGIHITMSSRFQEMEEANITRKRLEYFDVGNLPAIKGVQITTGTNAVIELEHLSGAKSTSNPREIFAKIPGLNIWESDGAGIQIGIGGRGLSPNRAANFNTRQNGYDISADALGYPESYYTPPFEALKSIEIVRGSASLQFGTQFGGLLNFIIKDAPTNTPLEITTRTTGGSYGYLGTFNRIAGSKKKISYQAYHQYKRGDGYRTNSGFKQHQAFGQLSYYLNENIQLRLEYTHMSYLTQQAGGLSDFQFNQDPRQSVRDRNWFDVNWNMLAVHFDYEIGSKSLFNIRAFGMQSSRESLGFLGKITQADPGGNRQLIHGDFKNGGVEARFLKRYTLKENANTSLKGAFLIGSRYYKGNTTSDQGDAPDGAGPEFRFLNPSNLENSSFDFPSENVAAFAENILFINKRLSLNMGVRFEHIYSASSGYYKQYYIHQVNNDTLAINTISDNREVIRNLPLFGGGASYKLKNQGSIYFNVTQNYRAINFTDIRVTNPNIKVDSAIQDEHGFTGEIGLRGVNRKVFIYDIAGFYVYYGDKIGLAPKPQTTYKERTNIGNAVNLGVECFVEFDFIKAFNDSSKYGLSLFVNSAYIHARYIDSKESNYIGKQVEYVSPFILKSGIKWKHDRFSVQFQGSYNSAQYSDASNSVEPSGDAVIGLIPSYLVFDFSSRFTLNSFIQFEAGVTNLTNQRYFTRRATAYPGPGILPSDGIGAYLTLQFKFAVKK
jgi:Fe(3+) dicitrate transport protein